MHCHFGGVDDAAFSFHAHSGHEEEDFVQALETVRDTLTEGRKGGATDFFVGGDLHIEFRPDNANEDPHGLDSIEWYGMCGPECKGGGEGAITCEKCCLAYNCFDCTVTSTWTNNEDNREFHTRWLGGLGSAKKKTARQHHGPEGHMLHDVVHA